MVYEVLNAVSGKRSQRQLMSLLSAMECYHDSLFNIFCVFRTVVWLDRVVNREWQSLNELEK